MDEALQALYRARFGSAPDSTIALKPHASERSIFRLTGSGGTVIGVHNRNVIENRAFILMSRFFLQNGLAVPRIFVESEDGVLYLEEDLGEVSLFELVVEEGRGPKGRLGPRALRAYELVLEALPRFQIEVGRKIDPSWYCEDVEFAEAAVSKDLTAFREQFLQHAGIPYDAGALAGDFERLSALLLEAERGFFMYRDFQSRNIMIRNGTPWFIDYQSGRWGPLQYDVVSLLHQASISIEPEDRAVLLNHYLAAAERHLPLDRDLFMRHYPAFVIIRLLQALGVYGREGLGKGKEYFLKSIPLATVGLASVLASGTLEIRLEEFGDVVERMRERFPLPS